jgi:HSP20 family molecular chaperone IbpA
MNAIVKSNSLPAFLGGSLFDEIFEDFWHTKWLSELNSLQNPAKMIWDDEKEEFQISIDATGIPKEDIRIESGNEGLIIEGELKDEKLKERIGNRKISYILKRNDIDPDSISAKVNNGILDITLKKNKDISKKVIEIQ